MLSVSSVVECIEPPAQWLPRSDRDNGSVKKLDFFEGRAFSALTAHLAILDENGMIVAVNRAGREFAAMNWPAESTPNVCEGTDYPLGSDDAFGAWSQEAVSVAAGIRAVLSGQPSEHAI